MKIYKSFKYRVYPTGAQLERLGRWNDALRFLWNICHEQRLLGLARPKGERRYPTAFDQGKELTELRDALPWLADVPRHVCVSVLNNLGTAWDRCFKRTARAPKWKRRGSWLGFTEFDSKRWSVGPGCIRFPKLGNLRAVIHRPTEGKRKSCTLSCDGDQWFVSVMCEIEIADPVVRVGPVVALDRGVVNVVADSDGRVVEAPRWYGATMQRLGRAQRVVSRRKKGSKNRDKAKSRVARLHRKVRRQREHFLHQLSAGYTKSHGVIVIEKLQIVNMVKANRGLARGILDAGWGKLVEQLRYKAAWSGGSVVEVPAAYSSQTCAVCGCVDADSRASQAEFRCASCGHTDHADLNAAKVLLTRVNGSGLPVEASPLGSRRSRKPSKKENSL